MLSALFSALRPKQWIKNGFVFLPLVFAGLFANQSALFVTIITFLIFCAGASGTYLINDVLDYAEDRRHPTKRLRPIASGKLGKTPALFLAGGLIIVSLLAAFALSQLLAVIVAGYLLLHVAYSFGLKHIAILDLLAIAVGFVLRVYAGAVVIEVVVSPWLIVLTLLVTLLLAVGKRLQEMNLVSGAKTRKVLSDYSPEFLRQAIAVILPAVLTAYLLYTFQSGHSPYLIVSVLPAVYGLLRYLWLLNSKTIKVDGPTELLFVDRPLQLSVLAWLLTVYVVLGYM